MRPRRPMSSASSSMLTPALTLRTLAALGTSLLKGLSRAIQHEFRGGRYHRVRSPRRVEETLSPLGPVTKTRSCLFLFCRVTRTYAEKETDAPPPSVREGMRASCPTAPSGGLVRQPDRGGAWP